MNSGIAATRIVAGCGGGMSKGTLIGNIADSQSEQFELAIASSKQVNKGRRLAKQAVCTEGNKLQLENIWRPTSFKLLLSVQRIVGDCQLAGSPPRDTEIIWAQRNSFAGVFLPTPFSHHI